MLETIRFNSPSGRQIISTACEMAAQTDRAAVLGGSIVAGLGTPASDVDIFLVGEGCRPTEQVRVAGRRLDVEYLDLSDIASTVQVLQKLSTPVQPADLTSIPWGTLERLRDICEGMIISDGVGFQDIVSGYMQCIPAIRELHALWYASFAANSFEDLEGFENIGDSEAAHAEAGIILQKSCKAFMAIKGDTYRGLKWTWSQWGRCGDKPSGLTDSSLRDARTAGVRAQVGLAQDLLIFALTGNEYNSRFNVPAERGHLQSVNYLCPMHIEEGYGLLGSQDRYVALSLLGLTVWGAARGRMYEDAVDCISRKFELSPTDVEVYLDSLLSSGALQVLD